MMQMETSDSVGGEVTIPCSVIILTLNEEINLADCLRSLKSFAEIHVVDSGSTDTTAAIACEFGAAIHVNAFKSFGQQRNWAHAQLPLQHPWVLHLDADERMTPELEAEIRAVIAAERGDIAGYFIAERTMLCGQWLRYAGQYPRYQARLVHRARMQFIDHGHGQREQSELAFARLKNAYEHHAFSQGIEHWLKKHAGYAMREAAAAEEPSASAWHLLNRALRDQGTERRRALKQLSGMVPARPFLRWFYVMAVCRGVLDGRAGWRYAKMMKLFQEMIDLCAAERRDQRIGRPAS